MAMFFRYKLYPVASGVVSLGGRPARPKPILGVTVVGPTHSRHREGLLDTGADDTVFPESLAPPLGIDLTNAPLGEARTANRARVAVRYALVHLRITDGIEQRDWPAWVGFTPAPLGQPLLGFAGFLQFFSANFHGDREQVELTVNRLYPGT